jgi:hypothetical protein
MVMKRYKLLMLSVSKRSILVQTTHPQVLDWIIVEAKKYIDSPFELDDRWRFPSGQTYGVEMKRKGGIPPSYDPIWWWLLSQLCERGWEPFAYDTLSHTMYLRLAEELQQGQVPKRSLTT